MEAAKEVHDFELVFDVEIARGFIEEKDAGLLGECKGDPRALTFATRKRRQWARGEGLDTRCHESPFDGICIRGAGALEDDPLVRVATAPDQFTHGEIERAGRRLGEQREDACDVARTERPNVILAEEHTAAARAMEPCEAAKEGALAAAVRANDRDKLARLDG